MESEIKTPGRSEGHGFGGKFRKIECEAEHEEFPKEGVAVEILEHRSSGMGTGI
jgi:hypothetical protein